MPSSWRKHFVHWCIAEVMPVGWELLPFPSEPHILVAVTSHPACLHQQSYPCSVSPGFALTFPGGLWTAASHSALQPSFLHQNGSWGLLWPLEPFPCCGCVPGSPWRSREFLPLPLCGVWVCRGQMSASSSGLQLASCLCIPVGPWLLLQLFPPFCKVLPFFWHFFYLSASRERDNSGVLGINKWAPPTEIRGEQLYPRKCLPNSAECGETNGIPPATTQG